MRKLIPAIAMAVVLVPEVVHGQWLPTAYELPIDHGTVQATPVETTDSGFKADILRLNGKRYFRFRRRLDAAIVPSSGLSLEKDLEQFLCPSNITKDDDLVEIKLDVRLNEQQAAHAATINLAIDACRDGVVAKPWEPTPGEFNKDRPPMADGGLLKTLIGVGQAVHQANH